MSIFPENEGSIERPFWTPFLQFRVEKTFHLKSVCSNLYVIFGLNLR